MAKELRVTIEGKRYKLFLGMEAVCYAEEATGLPFTKLLDGELTLPTLEALWHGALMEHHQMKPHESRALMEQAGLNVVMDRIGRGVVALMAGPATKAKAAA